MTEEAEMRDLPPAAQRTIILHDFEGVTLLIGEEKHQQPVLVSIDALRLASPVWKAMFDPNKWAESKASEIPFPDDDPEAMLIVLRIAHLRFADLPQKRALTFETLLNVARVCDKYDLVHIVRPFLDMYEWAKPFVPGEYVAEAPPGWLFIAWTFGYAASFESLACILAQRISLASDGTPMLSGKELSDDDLPPDMLDSFLEVRNEKLREMLADCYGVLDKVLSGPVCQMQNGQGECWDEGPCRAMILGSLIPQLTSMGIYPTRKAYSDIRDSLNTFKDKLVHLQPHAYTSVDIPAMTAYARGKGKYAYSSGMEAAGLKRHSKCVDEVVTGLHAESAYGLYSVDAAVRSPVLGSHKRHMEQQAKK